MEFEELLGNVVRLGDFADLTRHLGVEQREMAKRLQAVFRISAMRKLSGPYIVRAWR